MEEVEKVWRCRHENIQPLIEFGAGDGLLYSVTEAQEVETLDQFLKRWERENAGAALPVPLVVRWTKQLCDALDYAHERGIVHGNIQPSSILLRDEDSLLLTNFGMKRITQEADPAVAQVEEGNASFVAPEQSVGMLSPASDIYALGVLLFRLFTGQLPYRGKDAGEVALNHANEPIPSLRALCHDMPEAVEMVVRVALAKTAAARFPTAGALSNALLSALVKDEVPPVIATTQTIMPRRRVRGRGGHVGQPPSIWSRVVTLTSVLVVLAGLLGVLFFFASTPFHLGNLPFLPIRLINGAGGLHMGPVTSVTPVPPQSTPSPVAGASGGGGTDWPPTHGKSRHRPGTTPTATATVTPITGVTPTPGSTATPAPLICSSGTLVIDGSPYLTPVLAQVNQDYLAGCPGLNVTLRSDGSRALNLVQRGRIDMADTDVTATAGRNLVDHPIAALLYTLIASPDVPLSGLSSAEIQGIYAGQITNWSQVGGPNERVVVIFPPPNASINAIFRAFVLNGAQVQVHGYTMKKDNPSLTAQLVAQMPGAISYVPAWALSSVNVQQLAIDGVTASIQALTSNSYPFWSVEHIYTQGDGSDQAQAWMEFLSRQQETNALLLSGVAPIAMLGPGVLLSHLPGPQF